MAVEGAQEELCAPMPLRGDVPAAAESPRGSAEEALRQIIVGTRCIYWYSEMKDVRGADGVLTTRWEMHIPYEDLVKLWFPVTVGPGQTLVDVWHDAIPPEDRKHMDMLSATARRSGYDSYTQEYRIESTDGAIVWISERVQIERLGPRHWRYTGICTDITEGKTLRERLEHQIVSARDARAELESGHRELVEDNAKLEVLASIDGLTSIRNYRVFKERLSAELLSAHQNQTPLSLIMLDLDRFKQYNDTYGHLAGDDVLKMAARLLHDNARDVDCVARYGGEEFVVILPTDKESAMVIANRLRAAFEHYPWPRRPVTASFGVATLLPSAAAPAFAALMTEADQALYYSKARGRNCVTHVSDMSEEERGTKQHIAINCGGENHWPFMDDIYFKGGKRGGAGLDLDPSTFDFSAVDGPVPPEIYQTERYGDFTYTIPGLAPAANCAVRLHFAEMWFDQLGDRVFDVAINGTKVLTNFDVIEVAGANLTAIVRKFPAVADDAGKVIITFSSIANNSQVNAIEVIW